MTTIDLDLLVMTVAGFASHTFPGSKSHQTVQDPGPKQTWLSLAR